MLYLRRSNSTQHQATPNKRQWLDVINRLCNQFYPQYKADSIKYGMIKQFINNNKVLYPWLTRDMLYNSIRRIDKATTSEQTNNSASTTAVIPTSNVNSTSESSLSNDNIDYKVLVI